MMLSREITEDIRNSSTAIALIEAGIDQFGLYGLKATTRNVAEHASANIAAIPYYFRNKQGLYSACMHYIVDEILDQLGEQLSGVTPTDDQVTPEQAKQAYLTIIDKFCLFFLQNADTLRWAQFITREHATPTEAYDIFYSRYYQHAQKIKAKLLAICLEQDENDDRIKILSHALFGQVLGFLVARESLLRGLGVTEISAQTTDLVRATLRDNVLATLAFYQHK